MRLAVRSLFPQQFDPTYKNEAGIARSGHLMLVLRIPL